MSTIQNHPADHTYRGTLPQESVQNIALNLPMKDAYALLSVVGSGMDIYTDDAAQNHDAEVLEKVPFNQANDTSFWKLWGQVHLEMRDDALLQAIKAGKTEMVKGLIESYDLPVELIRIQDQDLFCFVIESGKVDLLRAFIEEYNVDVNQPIQKSNGHSQLPLEIAALTDNVEVTRGLLEKGAKGLNEALLSVVSKSSFSNLGVIRLLIEYGASVNARFKGDWGITILHQVVMRHPMMPYSLENDRHRAKMIRLIVELGGDPGSRSDLGWTPLHFAAQMHLGECVKTLVGLGVDIRAQDNFGKTPIDLVNSNLILKK